MNTFIVILSDIPKKDSDAKFADFISENNYEFWRHTTLNWIVLTPDDISTDKMNEAVMAAYGSIFICVLKVDIKGFAGLFLRKTDNRDLDNPFKWFEDIFRSNNFIPKWESENVKSVKQIK